MGSDKVERLTQEQRGSLRLRLAQGRIARRPAMTGYAAIRATRRYPQNGFNNLVDTGSGRAMTGYENNGTPKSGSHFVGLMA